MESGDKTIINQMLEKDAITCDAIVNGARHLCALNLLTMLTWTPPDAVIDTMDFFRLLKVESEKVNISSFALLYKLDNRNRRVFLL